MSANIVETLSPNDSQTIVRTFIFCHDESTNKKMAREAVITPLHEPYFIADY